MMNSDEAVRIGIDDLKVKYGITFEKIADGEAVAILPMSVEHMNFYGIPYGGEVFHIADVASGMAFLSAGGVGPTVSANIDFMRGAKNAAYLKAVGRVIKKGRRLFFVDADVYSDQEILVSRAHFVYTKI